jgi:hypothetical protein
MVGGGVLRSAGALEGPGVGKVWDAGEGRMEGSQVG